MRCHTLEALSVSVLGEILNIGERAGRKDSREATCFALLEIFALILSVYMMYLKFCVN